MRHRNETRLLAEIVEIRNLQSVAAEAAAARAVLASRATDDLRRERESLRSSAESNWHRAVSAPSLALEMLNLLSVDFRRCDAGVARATSDAKVAAQDLVRRSTDWHVAALRQESSKSMRRAAVRDEMNRRDEMSLQDALDRHTRREDEI
jgi:hypothetical protein